MQEQDNDRLEQFFRKAASKPDVSFDEDDWKKLEARLDAEGAPKPGVGRPGRKMATTSAVSVALLLSLMFWLNSGDDRSTVSEPLASASQVNEASESLSDASPGEKMESSSPERQGSKIEPVQESTAVVEETGRNNEAGRDDEGPQGLVRLLDGESDDGEGVAAPRFREESAESEYVALTGGHGVVDAPDEKIYRDLIEISTATAGKNKQKAIVELPGAEEVETGEAESMVREDRSDQIKRMTTPRLSLLLSFAPDFSSTSLGRYSAPGKAFGAMLRYHVTNRWSLSAGIIKNNKQYTGDGEDYSPPKGYWKYYTNGKIPNTIDGSCTVVEFPLTVQYAAVSNSKHRILVGAGASSYLMSDESYHYNFDEPNPGSREGWDSESESRFMFNMINFSLGYEREVMPGFMIGIAPYIKIPIEEIGWSNLKLFSTGASLTMRYSILRKRNPSVASRSRGPD